jgi:hypothetical protein
MVVSILSRLWRPALAAGALCVAVGGAAHPIPYVSPSFEQTIADMLADPGWVPSHAIVLVGLVLMIPGLLGLGRIAVSSAMRAVVGFAVAGALLSVVEMAFHVAAVIDLDALVAGRPTPVLHTHMVLEAMATPLFGFPLAALAFLAAKRGTPVQALVDAVGILGGLMFGLAGPVVVGTRAPEIHLLFSGSILLSLWLFWMAATSGRALNRPGITGLPRSAQNVPL